MKLLTMDATSGLLNEPSFSKEVYQKWFWIGFLVYTCAYTMYSIDFLSHTIWVCVQMIGLLLFLPSAIKLSNWPGVKSYFGFMYLLLMAWSAFIMVHGFNLSFTTIKNAFFNPFNGFLLYLSPLILLFISSLKSLRMLFDTIMVLGYFFVFSVVFFWGDTFKQDGPSGYYVIEYFVKLLSLPCGFIVLTYPYHSKKRVLLALATVVASILVSIFQARRGLLFMTGNVLVFAGIIYVTRNLKHSLLIGLAGMLSMALLLNFLAEGKKLKFLDSLSGRMGEDTRTSVEDYYYADMKQVDWVIGKGIHGEYYCPVETEEDGITLYRDGIETDYLNLILKGGVINLGLHLLIAIPALILGLFFSKNLLVKASACWILMWLMALYPSPITTFTLNYLLVWISIGICYSGYVRGLTDDEIMLALKTPGTSN